MPSIITLLFFLLWNVAAGFIFWAPHQMVRTKDAFGLTVLVLMVASAAYGLLSQALHQRSTATTKHWLRWVLGFHLIFWAETVMEAGVFTILDFHNTDANDIYFMVFWLLNFLWLIGGGAWTVVRIRKQAAPSPHR